MADSNEIKQTPIKQDEEQFENGFAPIASFTQRINALSKSGKLEYPKYRTLSEEQTRSYEKAKDLPEYQRKAMVSDVVASDEQTAWQNAKNSAIIYAMDALSGAKTELALGNMLVSDDYTPLIRTGAEIAGGAVGYETAKQAGKGALKRLAGAAIGGAGAGAIIGALTPSSTVSQEEEYESLLKSGWKPVGKSEKDFAKNQLRAAGLSEEEIADLTKPSKLKTIGKSLLQAGWDKVNYKASISPRVDEDSLAAFITQGALSMGEYLLIGAGGKILGTQVGRAAMRKANITPTVATRLKNITGKDVEPTRLKGVSKDALERKAQSIGVKAGQTAASTNMAVDVIGGGAVASIQKYVEETGDVNLDNYTADIRNVAIDAYSAYAQGLIENKLGAGKILGDKRLVSKWGEWLNGFVQEFTQGEVNDIAEWTKGNATLEEIVKNIPANIASGILGSFLQGSMGTAVYAYHHKKNVDDLTSVIMAQSTKENPIDEKKARQFAEQKVNEVESGVAQNLAKDLINFTGAGNYQGKIFNTIRDNVEKATKYQQEIMKDTLEGSNYDSMTEDDLALHIESVAEDNTDRAVIDALERKIPLSESPLLKGETLDGTYYIEGSDYAKETARQARQTRNAIRNAVYEGQKVEESAKELSKGLKDSSLKETTLSEQLDFQDTEADQLEFQRKIAKKYFDDFNEDVKENGLSNFVKEDGVYKQVNKTFPAIEINSKHGQSAAYDAETQTIFISIKGLENMTEDDIVNFIKERENQILQRIQHEFKHFYDISKGETINKIKQLLMKILPSVYFNEKLEVNAFMQEMLSEIAENFNLLDATTKNNVVNLERHTYIDNMYNSLLRKYTVVKAWNKKNTDLFKKRLGEQFDLFQEAPNRVFYHDNQRGKGGAFDPRTRSITLGAKANAGTWEHEFAHYWVNVNFKWARSGKASVAWMNQWRAVEKWLGIDPEDKYLDSLASEKFARAYERFLAEEELPLVLKKSMADFRDFILDHYDFELDDAKGLQDKLGRPIKLDESTKEWFRKSVYKEYMSPTEMAVVNERLALDDQERKDIGVQLEESAKMQSEIATSPELNKIDISGGQIQREAGVSNNQILGKRTIGGGEEKESKGQIAKELGKTYESTNWEIQEQLVNEYLETVSVDEAIEDLDNETYPEKIDANFLRQALVEQLLDQGRELEAVALIEQTADDFTQAAQTLQAARKINTPFTNAVRMLSVGKAEKLAQARYGRNANAVAELDKAMNALIDKYESDFMNAQTEEERELVYAALQDEAIRTIGTLDKSRTNDLDFQDVEDKEERKQAKAIRKQQIRRASIKGYRSRAKRALKQALGIEPTRQQVREIKRLAAEVAKEIRDFRKAVAENKTSAIDPTKVLVAQNKLNEYMNKQLPPRVLSTLADATNSFMMANMLWNPATNVFNIESTLVQMIPHLMASTINYGGGVISWPEKAKLIKQALVLQAKTGYNIFSLRDFFDKKTIWAEKYYEPTSKLGKAQRFPLTALGLMDTTNKGIVFLHHADSMATKQAKEEGKKNGWTDSQVKQRAKELFYQALNTDPRTITMDGLKIRQASVKEGEEATFTQMTKTAEMVNKFRKILNLGGKTGLGNVIMPFTTTVANIAEDTVLNYGLGAVRGLVKAPQAIATQFDKTATAEMKKEAWKAVQPETKNVIKNAIGVILLLSIALSGIDDEEYVLGYDRQTDMDKDIRNNRNAPYGYAIRIGDKWIDLDLFGIGSPYAKMYLIAKRHGFTSDGWIKGIASNIDLIPGTGEISSMYNKYTQKATWEDSTSAWKELGSEKIEEIAVRLIPASALFGQIGNIMDDKKRESWNNWYDKILVKIPELRETLPARTSTQTGKEIPQTDSWANLLTGQRIKDYVESNAADRARYEFALEDKALSYREGNSKLKELGKDTKRYKDAVSRVRKLFTAKLEAESKKTSYQRLSIKEKREIANKLHKEALEDVKRKLGLAKPKKRK